ncbi:MAG TPA: hypothetical protein VMM76_04125 [Pirellulaceae bacterium]|nr:hypothetical protein [Pirellulaceae bacterium]
MILALLSSASLLRAERPHDWAYLEGSWQFEASNGYTADIEYNTVAGGIAAIGKWKDKGGGQTIETLGWHPDEKAMVSIGFGSGAKFWQYHYTHVTEDKCSGTAIFIDPNGTVIQGNVSLTRVGPDSVSGQLVGKTKDGEQVNMSVKFTRKTP